jgi:diaminopimelate epimerase
LIDHGATVVMPGGTLQVLLLFHEDEIRGIRVAGRRSDWLKSE